MRCESDRSQSSAAGCGTNASESAQVCASVWLWTVRGKYHRSTNDKRQIVVSRTPFAPNHPTLAPPPSPTPPTKNIVFSLTSLAETHGSYQGKIDQPLYYTILTADRCRRYCQQTARKSTGGGQPCARLEFPYK
jgi:hypothetical protein